VAIYRPAIPSMQIGCEAILFWRGVFGGGTPAG